MLRLLNDYEVELLIDDDPVRPHLDVNFRTRLGRKSYCWEEDGVIEAVCCLAFTFGVPQTEDDLDLMSFSTEETPCIVPYTIWSYAPRAGRTLLLSLLEKVKYDYVDTGWSYKPRLVTLSPKTELAEKFHLSNGATKLRENTETVNFEYDIGL